MSKQVNSHLVPLEAVRRRRPPDENRVTRVRNQILAESRAQRLVEIRKAARLTQAQLASRMGVDQPRVSRIERGDLRSIELGNLMAYAAAVGGAVEVVFRFGQEAIVLALDPQQVRQADGHAITGAKAHR